MGKKLTFMVLDSETATLPFASEIASGDAEKKKRIAIARPLIYDLGYVICNRDGNIIKRVSHLITETFCVPSVFNTAYYAEKRPQYLERLAKGEIDCVPWNVAINELLADLETVDAVGAFNAMFDFKKAITFTDLYIKKVYSADYAAWEAMQRGLCKSIADKKPRDEEDKPDFDAMHFNFRGKEYDMFCLWGLSCEHLLNNYTYKKMCLEQPLLTKSGEYFSTSAESAYKYLRKKYDFEEAHTALEDAEIEAFILSKIAAKHKIDMGITFFPFKILGSTVDFLRTSPKGIPASSYENVIEALDEAMRGYTDTSAYYSHLQNERLAVKTLYEIKVMA